MSVQRRINTRNLRSYFPVKKSTNLCLTKGSADSLTNAAITSKLSAVHSTTVLNGETSKEISKVNVVNRNNSESHLLKKVQDDRMQNSKFSTLNNEEQHYVVPNANYRGENSEKDTAPLNIPRKRKACSNTEEVNDVNPLKMVKLDSVSCNVSSIREQHLKSSNVDTNLNDTRCIKITESKVWSRL